MLHKYMYLPMLPRLKQYKHTSHAQKKNLTDISKKEEMIKIFVFIYFGESQGCVMEHFVLRNICPFLTKNCKGKISATFKQEFSLLFLHVV